MSEPFTLRDGISFNIDALSRYGFEFFTFRSPPMRAEMDRFLAETKDCRRLLDIGAFHGVFSLVFCAVDQTRIAYAYEPSPKAYPILMNNVELNPFFNINRYQCAISDHSGALEMGYEWDHAVAKPTFFDHNTEIVTADAATVDSLTLNADVVKIDCEGHEIKVLRGMTETLKRCKPIVFLELRPEGLALEGDTYEDMVSIAESVGYTVTENDRHYILRP